MKKKSREEIVPAVGTDGTTASQNTVKTLVILTADFHEREACTFNGLQSGALGAPFENAHDRTRIGKKLTIVSALQISEVPKDPKPDLLIADLDSIAADYGGDQGKAARTLKRVLGVRYLRSSVVAVFMRLPRGELQALGFKRVLDRKNTNFVEDIAKEGCAVLPEALERYRKYIDC